MPLRPLPGTGPRAPRPASVGRWLLGRLARAGFASWGIASVVFLLLHLLPVTNEQLVAGEVSELGRMMGNQPSRTAALAAWQHRQGLDEPVFYVTRPAGQWQWHGTRNQYHRWVRQLLSGNLGYSYRTGEAVAAKLAPALVYTLPLMAAASVLATAGAIALALTLAATSARGWQLVRTALTAVQAMPLFALSLALLLLLANPDALDVLPANGLALVGLAPGSAPWLLAYGAHLVLPLLCLVLAALPELVLPLEAALRQELAAGYTDTARAKGLATRQVFFRHALPNALLPLLPSFTALLPTLVAGAVVVEVLFALPGTGRLLAEAAATHDYPVVVAGVLLAAAARLLAWLLADTLYFWADPRVRNQ